MSTTISMKEPYYSQIPITLQRRFNLFNIEIRQIKDVELQLLFRLYLIFFIKLCKVTVTSMKGVYLTNKFTLKMFDLLKRSVSWLKI